MLRRSWIAAAWALAAVYPAFLALHALAPVTALAAATVAEGARAWLPWAAGAILLAAWLAVPAVGERLRDAGLSLRAALTMDRHEVANLERSEADIANAYWAQRLGEALLARRLFSDAVAPLRRAIEREPGNAAAHDRLGQALLALGRPAEAAESFGRALEIDPRFDFGATGLRLAESLLAAGKPAEARHCASTYLSHFGDHPRALWLLGKSLESLGDRAGAAREVAAAVACIRELPRFARREHRFLIRRALYWRAFHPAR